MTTIETTLEKSYEFLPLVKMSKDLKLAASTLSHREAKYMVTTYYMLQDQRLRAGSQKRFLEKEEKPHIFLDWYFDQSKRIEGNIKAAMYVYASSKEIGRWAMSICGIAEVIAAGMIAHIDVGVPNCSHAWSFAGFNPLSEWKKGKLRPWNEDLHRLCWNMAECFVKFKSHKLDYYGSMYAAYKRRLITMNESGQFAERAKKEIARGVYDKKTVAYKWYKQGKLPPAHIHARAERWIAKLFLSHFHMVGFWLKNGVIPPMRANMGGQDHVHIIQPPNMDLIEGLEDAFVSYCDQEGLEPVTEYLGG